MARLRIVGGRYRGRPLNAPTDRHVRPTTDRVREALFNILEHMDPPVLPDATVLDLFAGTGALGLEALSRGAAQAVFVESDSRALALIEQNIDALGVRDSALVVRADAQRLGAAPEAATLVFADAPYGEGLIEPALEQAAAKDWLADGATIVIETDAVESLDLPNDFGNIDERTYGNTLLTICRYRSAPTE